MPTPILTDDFLKTYIDLEAEGKNPLFDSFNGLGYLVYRRTYSRPIYAADGTYTRHEEWWETVARVVEGAQTIGADYTPEEAERLFDLIWNLKALPGGRMLWQLGTDNVQRLGSASLVNCFTGDTEVITREGIQTMKGLAGRSAEVLTEKGWVLAPFRSFGERPVQDVVFRPVARSGAASTWHRTRSEFRVTETATTDHEWILADDTITNNLRVGDIVKAQINKDYERSREGFIHGFVFGDGTMSYERQDGSLVHRVRLCGEKDQQWLGVFEEAGWRRLSDIDGDPLLTHAFNYPLKKFPEKGADAAYLASFLDGWIAADGYTKFNGDVQLTSQHIGAGDWLRRNAAIGGYLFNAACIGGANETNYGIRKNPLMRYTLTRMERAWIVEGITQAGTEKTYCATVPEQESFTLASGVYTRNCYYTELTDPSDFRYLFEMLMLGGGVGFNVTQESVDRLPNVNGGALTIKEGFDVDFVVPDNREGWGELLSMVLEAGFGTNGAKNLTYSVDAIRPEGAPIKTFGGTASGPGILVEGIEKIQDIFRRAVKRNGVDLSEFGIGSLKREARLTTVDVLDIANIIGSIVVSGNVRRSAQIALGDQDDFDFLSAKRWDENTPAYRAMSNNTVYVSDPDSLPEEFWEGFDGKGEAYGLFNVDFAKSHGRLHEPRPDWSIEGVNPCGEIPLANRESCNLAELVLPKFEDGYELEVAAKLLYKLQKAVSSLPHVDPETDHITTNNMRLGLGVTGVAQASNDQISWLSPVYESLVLHDKAWSKAHGWPPSIRLTTVKPSGTVSLLAGVSPGVHGGYSRYHIRRVRVAMTDAVFKWAQEQGIPWEFAMQLDGEIDRRTAVMEFPCEFPEGTSLASEETAIEQLNRHRVLQREWADNAVSVTVTFKPEELPAIREYLSEHWATTKSISFLPYSDHGYVQAPLEPISEDEYLERKAAINITHSHAFGESFLGEEDCEGGACPIR